MRAHKLCIRHQVKVKWRNGGDVKQREWWRDKYEQYAGFTPPGRYTPPPAGKNLKRVWMRPWLGWQHMIKYNCTEQFRTLQSFWKKQPKKVGKKKKSQVCEGKGEFCKTAKEIKTAATAFRGGWFLHAHAEQIEHAGVQGRDCHMRVIDGSVWMLKSTEPEHVSAARPGPPLSTYLMVRCCGTRRRHYLIKPGGKQTGNHLSEEPHDYKTQNTAALRLLKPEN